MGFAGALLTMPDALLAPWLSLSCCSPLFFNVFTSCPVFPHGAYRQG
jgi:hypothetical protein